MATDLEFDELVRAVTHLPIEQRAALVDALIDSMIPDLGEKPTIDQLVGVGRGNGPPPTDDEVRQWIDEHRMQKYGG